MYYFQDLFQDFKMSVIDPSIPVIPIGHVNDLVNGAKYWIQIKCKTKKAFKEAGENHNVRLFSGTFQGIYEFRRRIYALFTDLVIEDNNTYYIMYDHNKIKVPSIAFDNEHWMKKPIFDKSGTLINVKETFSHQELDINTKFNQNNVFFDCNHWIIGENPPTTRTDE